VRVVNKSGGWFTVTATLPRPSGCPTTGACAVSVGLAAHGSNFFYVSKRVAIRGLSYRVTLSSWTAAPFERSRVLDLRSYAIRPVRSTGDRNRGGATNLALLVTSRRGRDHATAIRPMTTNETVELTVPDVRLTPYTVDVCRTTILFDDSGRLSPFDAGTCLGDPRVYVSGVTSTGMKVRVSWFSGPPPVGGPYPARYARVTEDVSFAGKVVYSRTRTAR
jgi:hypothetical protein